MTKQRKRKRKSAPQMKKKESSGRTLPLWERVAVDLLEMPRLARMFVATFFALAVTLAVSPVIDIIYLNNFFDESTVIVPALVAGAFGLLMYIAGYLLIVGWQGEDLSPRRAVIWYVIVGLIAMLVVAVWFVFVLIR